jgi:hypothetical protein
MNCVMFCNTLKGYGFGYSPKLSPDIALVKVPHENVIPAAYMINTRYCGSMKQKTTIEIIRTLALSPRRQASSISYSRRQKHRRVEGPDGVVRGWFAKDTKKMHEIADGRKRPILVLSG